MRKTWENDKKAALSNKKPDVAKMRTGVKKKRMPFSRHTLS